MSTKRTLLVIAKSLDGGTGTFVHHLMKLVVRFPNQYRIKIIVLTSPSYRTASQFSVPISVITNFHRESEIYRFSPTTLSTIVKELICIFREADCFSPSIIVTIDSHAAFLGCVYKLIHPHVRLVLTIHNNLQAVTRFKLTRMSRKFFFLAGKFLFPLSDAIVGVSHGVSDNVKKLFDLKKHVITIYNGLPVRTPKTSILRKLSKQSRFPKLISIGRFTFQKDFDTLINAVRRVKNMYPHIRLTIIGDGPDRTRLEKIIMKQHLNRNIVLKGWKTNIEPFLFQANIFILSSHFEGFSYALLEAMSRGLPVISTNTPYGPSEILDNGKAGILVPPSNPEEMAQAIISLMYHPKRYQYMSRAALLRSRYFSEERMLQEYHKIFSSQSAFPFPVRNRYGANNRKKNVSSV